MRTPLAPHVLERHDAEEVGAGMAACTRCGLRAVQRELERRGIVFRFCDMCYWGALDGPAAFTRARDPLKTAPSEEPVGLEPGSS